MIQDILDNKVASVALSCVLGFGFALMFRRVCDKKTCAVIRGPSNEELKHMYSVEDSCVRYKRVPASCDAY